MAAPAAIGVFILTVIVIIIFCLIAICFKVRKKKTRARNRISVAYPGTNTVRYMTNANVISFEPFNECVDPNIIYDELPEIANLSQDSEEKYTSMENCNIK